MVGAHLRQGHHHLIPHDHLVRLAVNAPGVSDLSVLSKAAHLGRTAPVNEGTGTVVDPKP